MICYVETSLDQVDERASDNHSSGNKCRGDSRASQSSIIGLAAVTAATATVSTRADFLVLVVCHGDQHDGFSLCNVDLDRLVTVRLVSLASNDIQNVGIGLKGRRDGQGGRLGVGPSVGQDGKHVALLNGDIISVRGRDACLGLVKVGLLLANSSSSGIELGKELVTIRVGLVLGSPHGLSILIVLLSTSEPLLLTIVEVRDTISDKGVGGGVPDQGLVGHGVFESRVVVVVQKASKKSGVLELGVDGSNHVLEPVDVSTGRIESSYEGKVDGVVEDAVHGLLLVGSNVVGVTIENFSDTVHASVFNKLGPKVFSNVLDGVDSNCFETISPDQVTDPRVESGNDVGFFSVEVVQRDRGVTERTLLDHGLVVVVCRTGTLLVDRKKNTHKGRMDVEKSKLTFNPAKRLVVKVLCGKWTVIAVGLETLRGSSSNVIDDLESKTRFENKGVSCAPNVCDYLHERPNSRHQP